MSFNNLHVHVFFSQQEITYIKLMGGQWAYQTSSRYQHRLSTDCTRIRRLDHFVFHGPPVAYVMNPLYFSKWQCLFALLTNFK